MAKSQQAKSYALDLKATPPLEAVSADSVSKALALVVDNEAKLLAAYEVRQASADTRITGLATASVALLTLTLSLSKAFSRNPARLQVVYAVIVAAAVLVGFARAWNGWRKRALGKMSDEELTAAGIRAKDAWTISSEAVEVSRARRAWRSYQLDAQVGYADQIRVQQLALAMWRARADDSHHVAQIKDKLSVLAAVVFAVALGVSAYLVATADFS